MWRDLWTRLYQMVFKPLLPPEKALPPRPDTADPQAWSAWLAQIFAQSHISFAAVNPGIGDGCALLVPSMKHAPSRPLLALKGQSFTAVKFGGHWAFANDGQDGEIVLHPEANLSSMSHMATQLLSWHVQTPFEEGDSKILLSSSSLHDRMTWMARHISVYIVEQHWNSDGFDHDDLRVHRQGRHLVMYDVKDPMIMVALQT